MSSIQERLQLKRVPLDTWNIREQLCLASAVVRSGDQNWMSVSRALKTVGEPNRPPDWYSQKSCAAQYGALLEHVETPKRKKRSSEGAVETPQESILKRLTQERIVEIQKTVAEMNQQYELLQDEINEVRSSSTSEDRLRELWAGIEAAKRARERENAKRAQWLKERDERRAKAERTWRPGTTTPVTSSPTHAPPSSPLLTSLLKSSPVVTTPQHISHPANVIDSVSPSANAPTLSMLLEPGGGHVGHAGLVGQAVGQAVGHAGHTEKASIDHKHAAIENIKSQLVQIELQLKANSAAPSPAPPPLDIDDIEIKAEDVYAFRDVDIHIPPVTAMHKGNARTEKPPTFPKKEDSDAMETCVEVAEEKIEEVVAEGERKESKESEIETVAFPEVKFPTPEIKVIQSEEQQVKEESNEVQPTPDVLVESAELPTLQETEQEEPTVEIEPAAELPVTVSEEIVQETIAPEPASEASEQASELESEAVQPSEGEQQIEPEVTETDEPAAAEVTDTNQAEEQTLPQPEPEEETQVKVEESEGERAAEIEKEVEEEKHAEVVEEETAPDSEDQRTEDAEDALPLKEMLKEEKEEIKEELADAEETHTETDDDTPMEVVREEDKEGGKRRDYSRRKPASGACSGSESDSGQAPDNKRYRLWKKAIMYVYTRLASHKYASLFVRPITDEEAPGYSQVIRKPMDLTTIKKLIENGTVRTTVEFQRLLLLMLSNALMYNHSDHSVYQMARELHEEATVQVGMLTAAQAVAGVADTKPARRKRSKEPALVAPKRAHH